MISDLFPSLPDIAFAERDPAIIERELIGMYEKAYQLQYGKERKLYPGDPIRLLLETIAFALIIQRQLIDHTGKMNLLAYAKDDFLDHIGALLGVYRLPAQHALTTLRFTLSAPQNGVLIIPAGTRATPGGGDIIFETLNVAEIPAGVTHIDISAQCTIAGGAGNGFALGQINKIVDPFPWHMGVENITLSSGGGDVENNENLRERIQLAPEYFSVAGPDGAYIYWARTAHPGIIDVAVVGPPQIEPGRVEIYPLMQKGEIPTQDILDLVHKTCNADDIRPLTDHVSVLPPVATQYDLDVKFWINRSRATQEALIQKAVVQAIEDWKTWQKSKLGRDLNPSELNRRMINAGAKRTEIISPEFKVLERAELSVINTQVITLGGLEDD